MELQMKKLRTDGSIKAIYGFRRDTKLSRPLVGPKVPAGFPSPAQDYMEGSLDLNEYLVPHPASTFFVRVDGCSMIKAGIFPDDILVVDRSLEAVSGKIVVVIYDGELTVKRIRIECNRYWLEPENDEFESICVDEDADLTIWGVVCWVVHKV